MQAYRIPRGGGIDRLETFRRDLPPIGPRDVRVRVQAVSLNHRDLQVARDDAGPAAAMVVPGSDAAGRIVEIGSEVVGWRPGERVFVAFFPHWIDGAPTPENSASGFGGGIDGLLSQEVVVPAQALVRMPVQLDFAAAATLPCAGVTAWNALFVEGRTRPGDTVLLLGTGGVSIWALQLAKAAGLRVIITSSDDAKLARARELGAAETINYRQRAEWQRDVLDMTAGRGADLVLETGGEGTLTRSIQATRKGGTVAIIGGVSGGYGGQLEPFALIGGAKRLAGILVGSRRMAEDLAHFVEVAKIEPVIDKRFAFDEVRAAYAYLDRARHFGKVVIELQH